MICLTCKKEKDNEEFTSSNPKYPYKYCSSCRKEYGKYINKPLLKLRKLKRNL